MKLLVKLLLEFSPLVIFFIVTKETENFYLASGVLAIATAVTMVIMWILYRRLAWMAIITAVTSIGAGSLTYILQDPHYIYYKPTLVCLVFATILGGGLLVGKPLMQPLLGENLHITPKGWSIITFRWTIYFVCIAILNEILWRTQTQQFWVNFKVFGLLPLSILYGLAQIPILARHREPGVVVSHGAALDWVLTWFEDKPAQPILTASQTPKRASSPQ
jgi:intracellular septation protein